MTTFSQLVDELVLETRRPDMRNEIGTYLNQTIRELHFEPTKGNAIFYKSNLGEEIVLATLASGQGWTIPDSTIWQTMAAVRFDSVFDLGKPVYPPFLTPGRGLNGRQYFYYQAGDSYFFSGYGGVGAAISLAYYQYVRRLKYYAAGARPAEYDDDSGWTYAAAFDGTPELQASAQRFTTNWLLMRWKEVIAEGLRAKVYKRLSDDLRARTCYSLYSTLRQGLYTSEVAELGSYG